jgi:hypothetical protein
MNDQGVASLPRLIDLKTGTTVERPDEPICLGPQGNLALTMKLEPFSRRILGLNLHRASLKAPLATFATNFASAFAMQFNRQGTHFAWGTMDGTVILCDIAATQAKLAEARLGW